MEEVRRLAYLNAMGIDSYVSRQPLPGAKPSWVPEPSAEEDRHAEMPDTDSTMSMGHRGSAVTSPETGRHPVEQPGEEGTGQSDGDGIPVSEDSVPEDIGQLRFSLTFYPINDRLAVINEVPFSAANRTRQKTGALLLAILRALDIPLTEMPRAERFNWPLTAEDDASEARAGEAYQALAGFLRRRLESTGYRVLLVFAAQLQSLFDSGGIAGLLSSHQIVVIHTESLDAMLQVPALKKSVWQDIRGVPPLLSA